MFFTARPLILSSLACVIIALVEFMPKFSRTTLYEAYMMLSSRIQYHGDFDDLMYKWELDHFAEQSSGAIHVRLRQVFRYLKDNPDAKCNDNFLIDLFVEEALNRAGGIGDAAMAERDGFIVDENGNLRRMLPEVLDLPAADDEVHVLLDRYHLETTKGHLDQGIRDHAAGNWAAANAQFRTCMESLFDEIALLLDPKNVPALKSGETRRQFLANLPKPFLDRALNEWSDVGKNLVNGIFKRLHPQG